MSTVIADYIRDARHLDTPNAFKSTSVELGPTAVAGQSGYGRYALGDWRSADGRAHGQVYFSYECDGWNVGEVSLGRPLRANELISWHTPSNVQEVLVTELLKLEACRIAYLSPAVPSVSC